MSSFTVKVIKMRLHPFFVIALLLLSSCKRPYEAPCREYCEGSHPWAMAFRASDGLAEYEDEAYSQLQTVNGSLDLYKTLVTQYVMTDEKLAADCSDIGGVNVGGKAWVHKSIIRRDSYFHDSARFYESQVCGNITLCGDLLACDSIFDKNVYAAGDVMLERSCIKGCLTAEAEIIDLHCSTAQHIVIEPTGPYYDPQVVRLCEGSVVNGNLYFKSGKGKVCIDKTSCLQGQVYGGHIVPHHYWQEH